ncbi:MAG: DUF6430 domain-containing protein, partial [Erysipelotrichales bacterium]|nr:DUF6430 domain-containing protein [Erysipelotrichales bacterium]
MDKKVKYSDKRVIEQFFKIVGGISTILSMILIFADVPKEYKGIGAFGCFLVFLLLIYIVIWCKANSLISTKLSVGETTVIIKKGDVFKEEDCFKVIPFNEYFDTIVDDKIIAKKSLNGKYINNVYNDVNKLNQLIEEDKDLNNRENIVEENVRRRNNIGKTTKYKLGSSVVIDEYVLTAFSHFNEENEAYLSMIDYINFLLTFWNEINRVYAQKSVTVPLFGAGITRFQGRFTNIDDSELLMTMLWTFKLSETRFKYPAKLTIVIFE